MARKLPKTIFIAGARRGAGKTTLTSFLLRSLPGIGAIKVTCCRAEHHCPRDRPCGVCGALTAPFAVIQDRKILATPRKDTARLLEAATGKVVWLQSREEALGDALQTALSLFEEEPAVIVEGNAAFQKSLPDLGLLVIGSGPKPAKSSVRVALPHINAVVCNLQPEEVPPVMLPGIPAAARVFSFNFAQPEGNEAAAAFLVWIKNRLQLP